MTNWNPLNNYWKREMRYRAITGLIMLAIGLLTAMLIGGCKKPEDVKPKQPVYYMISVGHLPVLDKSAINIEYTDSNLSIKRASEVNSFMYYGQYRTNGVISVSACAADSSGVYIIIANSTDRKHWQNVAYSDENTKGNKTLTYAIP